MFSIATFKLSAPMVPSEQSTQPALPPACSGSALQGLRNEGPQSIMLTRGDSGEARVRGRWKNGPLEPVLRQDEGAVYGAQIPRGFTACGKARLTCGYAGPWEKTANFVAPLYGPSRS